MRSSGLWRAVGCSVPPGLRARISSPAGWNPRSTPSGRRSSSRPSGRTQVHVWRHDAIMGRDPDECLAASGAVRLRDPGAFESAVRTLSGCVEDGPRVLGALWLSPPANSGSRAALVRSTATLHDRRLFESIKTVVNSRTVSPELRVHAIDVLVRYFEPALSVVRWRGKLTTMHWGHAPEIVEGEVRQIRHELEAYLEALRTYRKP